MWRTPEQPGGDVPVILGSAGGSPGHRVHFFARSYAATPLDPSRHATVTAEFGIERFAKGYGLEPVGTGIGLGLVTRYDAYLCVYEADDLSQIGLTEQATSDPEAADVDEAPAVLTGAEGARVCLMIPYGYILGILRFDSTRRRRRPDQRRTRLRLLHRPPLRPLHQAHHVSCHAQSDSERTGCCAVSGL
jgi:hypothetical protein